jgi:hypothetical protein
MLYNMNVLCLTRTAARRIKVNPVSPGSKYWLVGNSGSGGGDGYSGGVGGGYGGQQGRYGGQQGGYGAQGYGDKTGYAGGSKQLITLLDEFLTNCFFLS